MGLSTDDRSAEQSHPADVKGTDVIAKAPTGTGKTCAFGIPFDSAGGHRFFDVQAIIHKRAYRTYPQICDDLRQLTSFAAAACGGGLRRAVDGKTRSSS